MVQGGGFYCSDKSEVSSILIKYDGVLDVQVDYKHNSMALKYIGVW